MIRSLIAKFHYLGSVDISKCGRLSAFPLKALILIALLSSLLLSCSDPVSHQSHEMKTYEVQPSTVHDILYFTGTIRPLHENTLTSPVGGVVETVHFPYGQVLKKGQVVFTLNSVELQKQYNDTLTAYLKVKDTYSISQAKFTGTEELWQAGLLSKNAYLSEKSGLNTARITLIQATRNLSEVLEKIGDGKASNLSSLSFEEFDKVRLALATKHNLIHILSPSDGVLLYPPNSGDDKAALITVGAAVKTGQVLALIGDLHGIRVDIDIPEVDLDKIKFGMPATIRGIAFGKEELKGTLVAINAQASTHNGGGLPSFTAIVEVNALNATQQRLVKVGMSASIELEANSQPELLVPIVALTQTHGGQSMIQVRAADGKVSSRPVITGGTHIDKVEIDSGLKSGDVVIY